jgi:hypothetical protein
LRKRGIEPLPDAEKSRPPASTRVEPASLLTSSHVSISHLNFTRLFLRGSRRRRFHAAASSRPLARHLSTLEINVRGAASNKLPGWMSHGFQSADVERTDRSYHISDGMQTTGVVSTVVAIGEFAREHGPGCYTVDQSYPEPLRVIGVISRAWGKAIHHADGQVTIRIEPTVIPGRAKDAPTRRYSVDV